MKIGLNSEASVSVWWLLAVLRIRFSPNDECTFLHRTCTGTFCLLGLASVPEVAIKREGVGALVRLVVFCLTSPKFFQTNAEQLDAETSQILTLNGREKFTKWNEMRQNEKGHSRKRTHAKQDTRKRTHA